jgi:hypothetical protein
MAWIRIVISAAASIAATVIGCTYLLFEGSAVAEYGGTYSAWLVPWFLATVALTGLVIGAIVSRSRSRRYH